MRFTPAGRPLSLGGGRGPYGCESRCGCEPRSVCRIFERAYALTLSETASRRRGVELANLTRG